MYMLDLGIALIIVFAGYVLYRLHVLTKYAMATPIRKHQVKLYVSYRMDYNDQYMYKGFTSREYLGKYAKLGIYLFKLVPTNGYSVGEYQYEFEHIL